MANGNFPVQMCVMSFLLASNVSGPCVFLPPSRAPTFVSLMLYMSVDFPRFPLCLFHTQSHALYVTHKYVQCTEESPVFYVTVVFRSANPTKCRKTKNTQPQIWFESRICSGEISFQNIAVKFELWYNCFHVVSTRISLKTFPRPPNRNINGSKSLDGSTNCNKSNQIKWCHLPRTRTHTKNEIKSNVHNSMQTIETKNVTTTYSCTHKRTIYLTSKDFRLIL